MTRRAEREAIGELSPTHEASELLHSTNEHEIRLQCTEKCTLLTNYVSCSLVQCITVSWDVHKKNRPVNQLTEKYIFRDSLSRYEETVSIEPRIYGYIDFGNESDYRSHENSLLANPFIKTKRFFYRKITSW